MTLSIIVLNLVHYDSILLPPTKFESAPEIFWYENLEYEIVNNFQDISVVSTLTHALVAHAS